jgi:V/A-type H+-transporting ATPase subunit C
LFGFILDPYNYPFWILIASVIIAVLGLMARPFSTYVMFAYPNAKYEAIGNPFISEKELNRVIETKDLINFKDALNASKDYELSGENTLELQLALDDNLIQTIKMMQKESSKKMHEFFNTFLEKYDIYLIKNAFKTKLEDKKIDEKIIEKAILPKTKEVLQNIIESERQNYPDILKNYGFEKELIDAVTEESYDILKIDTQIEKYIINKFKNTKVPYKCESAKQKFVGTLIDTITIKNILRAKQLGYDVEDCKKLFIFEGQEIAPWKFKEISEQDSVPHVISSLEGTSYFDSLKNVIEEYNTSKSVQVLENALDSNLLKLVENISTKNYVTIGPTIRFIVSKEFEIENLKIIAKGISEGLSSDIFKGFLVREVGS